jgi:hypothetical protein
MEHGKMMQFWKMMERRRKHHGNMRVSTVDLS